MTRLGVFLSMYMAHLGEGGEILGVVGNIL